MKKKREEAYTLVELLVVIGILSILFSVVYIGVDSGAGAKLSSAQRILSGLVKAARAQAILKNAEARLIIHNDTSDLERYRRFIGIVYYGEDKNGDTGWIAATKGTYLPKGIYFDSKTSGNLSVWPESRMALTYSRLTAQDGTPPGTSYLWYGFNDNGTSVLQNAYLIFRAASMIPNRAGKSVSELRVSESQSGLVSGLILRTSGTATLIDNPGSITVSNPDEIE